MIPLVPFNPEVPEVPELPPSPVIPDVPEVPDVPCEPAPPLTPEVPDVPAVPEVPIAINEPVATNAVLLFESPTKTYPSLKDEVNAPVIDTLPVICAEPDIVNPLSAFTYIVSSLL